MSQQQQQQQQPQQQQEQSEEDAEALLSGTDEFRMFHYKVSAACPLLGQ